MRLRHAAQLSDIRLATARIGSVMLKATLLLLFLCARAEASDVDPTAWLDDSMSPEVEEWSIAQERRAKQALESWPGRAGLKKRLTALLKTGSLSSVIHRGHKLFYLRQKPAENQPVLYVSDNVGKPPRPLIDPNLLSSKGLISLDRWHPSHDGLMIAYDVAELGAPEGVLHVREVDSGIELPDRIPNAPYASVAWLINRSGFYYTRVPKPGTVPPGSEFKNRHVYLHLLGNDPKRDELIFGPDHDTGQWLEIQLSSDGRFLLVTVYLSWSKTELYLRDLKDKKGSFQPLSSDRGGSYEASFGEDSLIIRTNEGAPRGKVIMINLLKSYGLFGRAPGASLARHRDNWRVIVPEGPWNVTAAVSAGPYVAVEVLERASSRLRLYTTAGKPVTEISLPASGSLSSFDGHHRSPTLAFIHESFLSPPRLYAYDVFTSSLARLDAAASADDLSYTAGLESQTVNVSTPGGPTLLMTLFYKERIRRDRARPTLLSAYEGFDAGAAPRFSPALFLWLEAGGLYALPHLKDANFQNQPSSPPLERRLSTYDAYTTAARWLIDKEYTGPARLVILGDSNGSLVADAAIARSPELFRAAILSSPRILWPRYIAMRSKLWWAARDGPPDQLQARNWLAAYSPFYRERQGASPSLLVLSRVNDPPEDQAHGRKLTALLQRRPSAPGAAAGQALLRFHSAQEPGSDPPSFRAIEEWADRYAFLFSQLGR